MAAVTDQRNLPGREGILDAAARLFLERGYRDTTLRDIAAEAGVKAASIYYHFDSKDQMLTTILDEGIARITDAVQAALAAAEGAPVETRIAAAIGAHLEALFGHGPYTAAHVSVFPKVPPHLKDAGVPARDAYEAIWTRLLTEARDRGVVASDIDLGVARLFLIGSMNASLEWFRPRGERALREVAETMSRLFLEGVR